MRSRPRSSVPTSTAWSMRSRPASTRWSSPPPSTRSGGGSSASTGTCRTSSPGSWRRMQLRPNGWTRCCTALPTACGWCPCCCTPSCRSSASSCSPRSAARISGWMTQGSARCPAGQRSASSASSSPGSRPRRRPPEAPAVIDTHCHLDSCEPPVAELVGRARAAGVTRMATVGMNGPSIKHALSAAEDDTFARLREHAASLPAVILHCFSAPDRLEECVEHGYLCSFAGNVTYPKATDLQQAARELTTELLLVETDSPYLSPQPLRGKPNEPANVTHTP